MVPYNLFISPLILSILSIANAANGREAILCIFYLHLWNMSKTTAKIISLGSTRILPNLSQQIRCRPSPFFKSFSTSTPKSSSLVTIERLEDDERIALVKLHRGPANALSLEFCQAISEAIKTLENDGKTNAMILSSSLPNKIFSAGLDISTELYKPDHDRLPEFWRSFQQLFLDLYGSTKLTTIANIEGAAPAGGCMLALSCDFRIVDACKNSRATIGLNESHLGIVAPPWMCQQYIDVLGHRQAELALISGRLFSPTEALKMGLVDELVEDNDGVSKASIARAKELVKIPKGAKAAVKQLTRMPLVNSLTADREKDVDFFCNFVTSENVQIAIGRYLEALASGKKKKK